MVKSKIAISIDSPLLALLDSKVDHEIIRSRSQALEFFLRRGLQGQSITTAALLIKGDHHPALLQILKNASLIKNHIAFFSQHGITTLYIITQHSKYINQLLVEIANAPIHVEIIEENAKGNAQALLAIKNKVHSDFLVISGDVYNNFDLSKMIKKHYSLGLFATMGLMTRQDTKNYGTAILDGDFIIDFHEKPKHSSTTIVNAGVYLFKPSVFELFNNVTSLERDLFPKLARLHQLAGFFTYGEYQHMGE